MIVPRACSCVGHKTSGFSERTNHSTIGYHYAEQVILSHHSAANSSNITDKTKCLALDCDPEVLLFQLVFLVVAVWSGGCVRKGVTWLRTSGSYPGPLGSNESTTPAW